MMIKAASSFLQELTNGKLVSTIKSFCARASAESSERYWFQHVKKQAVHTLPKSPTWARSPSELEAQMGFLSHESTSAMAVLASEQAVTTELRKLIEFGVSPPGELALFRKEFRALEEEFASAEDAGSEQVDPLKKLEAPLEKEFVFRKFFLFRARREGVENQEQLQQGHEQGAQARAMH
eukprot:FR739006.1.p1 GENE.FR739006.1~~FR739006.1.p1  ORF type:complete len:180 (-),score=30.19 FR739006.1:33-572(-)